RGKVALAALLLVEDLPGIWASQAAAGQLPREELCASRMAASFVAICHYILPSSTVPSLL
ncbi:MAG TPA: hypothetical protein VK968_18605, partial [Roseimicrobium sp.]|nr:hypothetical protein [Roseimicrobium sp.]